MTEPTDKPAPLQISQLTLGEIDHVERISGASINAFSDSEKPKGLMLAALVMVAQKRHSPKYTIADAMKLTMDEIKEVIDLSAKDAEVDENGLDTDPK